MRKERRQLDERGGEIKRAVQTEVGMIRDKKKEFKEEGGVMSGKDKIRR